MAKMVTAKEIQTRIANRTGTLADEWKIVAEKGPVSFVFENEKTGDRYQSAPVGFDGVAISPVTKP